MQAQLLNKVGGPQLLQLFSMQHSNPRSLSCTTVELPLSIGSLMLTKAPRKGLIKNFTPAEGHTYVTDSVYVA